MTSWNNIKRIDDDNVSKYVFEKDDAVAEMVLYRYPTYQERTVVCFSVQAGCPIGCRFCGAGDYFVRSLTVEEIVAQVDHAINETGLEAPNINRLQLMAMSMGEPLLNLKNLIPALRILNNKYPNAALLISTSAPEIGEDNINELFQVSQEISKIGLQFSIHESTDDARDKLIPFKKKMNLARISEVGTAWYHSTGRHPFFNYCAHDNNSSAEDAGRILALFDPTVFCATVSVVCERNDGLPATNQHQEDLAINFGNLLVQQGFDVRIFNPAGQDFLGGGCGQLWYVQQWFNTHPNNAIPSIGHGKPIVHTPTVI